jgi:two-component system, response regulator PdtaR
MVTEPKLQAAGSLRCLIVEDDTYVVMGLRAQLELLGHRVVGDASTTAEAERIYLEESPDLVLMDIHLDGGDGIELAGKLIAHRPCPVVILSAYGDRELVDRAAAAGVYGYLIKPVGAEAMSAQIEVALGRFRENMRLMRENQALLQSLETRKLVEKAKGIIMRRLKLDEPEAHRRLQLESQKRRLNLAEVAKKIIESEEILGGI